MKVLMQGALPIAALSYLLFHWSIKSGRLTKTGDHKAHRAQLKALKKTTKEKKTKTGNPVHNKWLKFGGGFYGVVALWTFAVVEMTEVFQFFMNFTSVTEMAMNISPNLVIGFFINSLMNFITAIAWPAYWLDEFDSGLILLWLIAAYAGYAIGRNIARRQGHAGKEVEG